MEYIEIAKSHIQYHRKLKDYVKSLKRSRDELNSKMKDIEQQLDAELHRPGKVPKMEVENWLKDGKEMIDKAQDVENEVNNGRYLFRAFLAKGVEEKTREMQDILNKVPNVSDGLVIDGPNVGLPLPTSKLIGGKVVRDQIWSYLMQEEVFTIGVWGMGGAGKTTIMKDIHNGLLKGKKFDKVIWVTISREFNIVNLQDDIASALGGYLPENGDKVRRAALLMNMLEKAKKHVLILDDVWDKISLEEVGIPEPNKSNGCKLVLTTRKEEVCRFLSCKVIQVFPLKEEEALTLFLNTVRPNILRNPTLEPSLKLVVKECAGLPLTIVLILDDVWDKISLEEVGIPEPNRSNGCKLVLTTRKEEVCRFLSCKVIQVFPLKEEEALTLFLNKVGPNILRNPTLEPSLKLVVKECAGLPLTIVVVAGTLKGVDDPRIWNNALNDLKQRIGEVEDVEAKVIECLKFSFDGLKDKNMQLCFLYCALYPEDFEIGVGKLIECWIDEGFIAEMDARQQMKDKGHAILKKLKDNCLLEDAKRQRVKMHDAVRDMALSITKMNPRYMIKAGKQLITFPKEEEWATNVEKVSLMINSISEIPIDLSPPKCQLTTLLLKENPIEKIPDSFFANMPCLSVLDLSFTEIECLPTSISELKNLTTLLLSCCERLKHLPSLSELQRLKKLDLGGSAIEEVPKGMEMLVDLRYLDLDVHTLKEVPAGLLPKLSRLQHLRLQNFDAERSIKAEEVMPLEKLEFFFGVLKDVHELKKFVHSMQYKKSLNAYRLQVGPSMFFVIESEKIVTISAQFYRDEVLLPFDIQVFGVEGCDLLRSLNDISSFKDAADLRDCVIYECQGIEFVISSFSFSTSCTPFQRLEYLKLVRLPRLSELIKAEGFASRSPILAPPAVFSHLKFIYIKECSNIKKLFLHWLLTNLQNLETIWVEACTQLVEIFVVATSEDDDDDEKESTDKIKVDLPKLKELELISLPELKSICSKSGVMICDSLEEFSVRECSKLKRIPPFVSLLGNEQPYAYAPPSLNIWSNREWWDSLEWDHPNFKNVLQPLRVMDTKLE